MGTFKFCLDQKPIQNRGPTVHFFADDNPLFALISEPTNQPLHNDHSIWNYNNVNGGALSDLHMLCVSCDAPPIKRECSCGADLLALSEYHIDKHLTGVQGQVIGHRRCESMSARCVFLGTHFSGNRLFCVLSHTYCLSVCIVTPF